MIRSGVMISLPEKNFGRMLKTKNLQEEVVLPGTKTMRNKSGTNLMISSISVTSKMVEVEVHKG
jgi:hypothetical protein